MCSGSGTPDPAPHMGPRDARRRCNSGGALVPHHMKEWSQGSEGRWYRAHDRPQHTVAPGEDGGDEGDAIAACGGSSPGQLRWHTEYRADGMPVTNPRTTE